ncbi:UbiD family decarboxylase [Mesorhizobium sp. WSM4884]|uniref:UbiD family decarboxylase n=1 Tax=Mesorhizobium sp. WSM4884 TaxID=3038542 RepID=UPI002415BF3D|nr:UbiD family decarboxylase [Mesorhizobium sp. WSM4884]MDG4880468.1 UbiD family decarboxylase [Mesorhizobium sp. WSM4884]
MHYRLLPQFSDLGSFLSYVDAKGQLREIRAPVSTRFELTEIHKRVIAAQGPALRMAMPMDDHRGRSPFAVVANIFGTRERVAWGLGTDIRGLETLGALLAWMRSPQVPQNLRQARHMFSAARGALAARPKIVSSSRIWRDAEPDFAILPVQTCWPEDAGPLITWPVVVTRPPGDDDPGKYNLGIYRMQVIARDRAIIRWLPMRGGAAHHRMWQARGLEMPVAVVIGADPATLIAAVMPAPEGVSELSLSGMINDRRVGLSPCRSIELHVPASSEIVLEGTVSPNETAQEGPFGDHTGYYNGVEHFPVFKLKRIRVRDGANYLTTFTGRAPDEPSVLAEALLDVYKPLLRQQIPEILDVWLPPEACSYRIAVISIVKKYAGQARRVMMGFWSLLPQFSMTKMVVVVDEDIDIRSWSDVMWAVATRMDVSRDLMKLDRTPIDSLDFASPLEGLGGKIGFDATRKIGSETSREWGKELKMSSQIVERVSGRWAELFPQPTGSAQK